MEFDLGDEKWGPLRIQNWSNLVAGCSGEVDSHLVLVHVHILLLVYAQDHSVDLVSMLLEELSDHPEGHRRSFGHIVAEDPCGNTWEGHTSEVVLHEHL